jgi:ATP-dependent Clp protease ATP-binding subunit ClpB
LFDDERAMQRIDMSEYMEKHAVARLIGAPPGYVGYEEGGQLTEPVRRRPYSVLLFDEIEKAHPDVFNIFLQILDEGRLTDGQGRTVDFKNTVIIMTSNIASAEIHSALGLDDRSDERKRGEGRRGISEDLRRRIQATLLEHFRPEFINRIDDIVIFNPLGKAEIERIVDLQLDNLRRLLAERKVEITLTDKARELLFREGYDPQFGARPLKRAIQRLIQDPLAMRLLDGDVMPEDHVVVDADLRKSEMKFEREAVKAAG